MQFRFYKVINVIIILSPCTTSTREHPANYDVHNDIQKNNRKRKPGDGFWIVYVIYGYYFLRVFLYEEDMFQNKKAVGWKAAME